MIPSGSSASVITYLIAITLPLCTPQSRAVFLFDDSRSAPGMGWDLGLSAHARLFEEAIWRTRRSAPSASVDTYGRNHGYSQETSATTATGTSRSAIPDLLQRDFSATEPNQV